MPQFVIVVRTTSTEQRDGGASWDRDLACSPDGAGLRHLASVLTAAARSAREAFHAGPADRTLEERHASMAPYEEIVSRWFDVGLKGDLVSFHVKDTPDLPFVDPHRLRELRCSQVDAS